MTVPKIACIVPYFGSNRMLAENVGKALEGCAWVGIPFAGSMAELPYIKASTIVVSDLHRDVINLANVLSMTATPGADYIAIEASKMPFHPDTLATAQAYCKVAREKPRTLDYERALWYFVSQWMSRSGKSGTDKEFEGKLPVRWSASGGDSNTRYRSAIESLKDWQKILVRCNFVVQDVFEFMSNMKDEKGHGVYLDPPFPEVGDAYSHKFTEDKHDALAAALVSFKECRIVARFYDHPLIRRLYPEIHWTWHHFDGRKQSNAAAPEVLLVRN